MARCTLKIIGAQYYPPKDLTYVILGIPPLELQHQRIIIKFILKCIHTQDDTTARIYQIEQSPGHPFYHHILKTKEFLRQKFEDLASVRIRDLELSTLSTEQLIYQKNEVLSYICSTWDKEICLNLSKFLVDDPFSIEDVEDIRARFSRKLVKKVNKDIMESR